MIFTPDLDSLTATLDTAVVGYLGDPLLYSVNGAAGVAIKGFVDDTESVEGYGTTSAVARQPSIEVREVDLPARPTRADRVTVVRTGEVFIPVGAHRIRAGGWWRFTGEPVPQ